MAFERLAAIIRDAGVVQKKRRPTQPTMAARKRRIESKVQHGQIKALRHKPIMKVPCREWPNEVVCPQS